MNWETYEEKSGMTHHLDLKPEEQKVIGWGTTGHWRSETGNATSFKRFLEGEWDDWITEIFGTDILEKAKFLVKMNYKEDNYYLEIDYENKRVYLKGKAGNNNDEKSESTSFEDFLNGDLNELVRDKLGEKSLNDVLKRIDY